MKKFKNLREKEGALCKRLALPPHDTSIGEKVPTTTQVKEIEANIHYMENELVRTVQVYQNTSRTYSTSTFADSRLI